MYKLLLGFALSAWLIHAHAEQIISAQYAKPSMRYGHFAVGQPHEYARIVAKTDQGRELTFDLPAHEVFEDMSPRLVRMQPNAPTELLSIVSAKSQGSRMVVLGIKDGRLHNVAQSPPIGQQNRWLNPVAVIDLDGDGIAEIAAVTTPHIGGTLRVYKRRDDQLIEYAAMYGFSNHVFGSSELDLSKVTRINGETSLLVPDLARTSLIAVTLRGTTLVKTMRCRLNAPITQPSDLLACGSNGGKLFAPHAAAWQAWQ